MFNFFDSTPAVKPELYLFTVKLLRSAWQIEFLSAVLRGCQFKWKFLCIFLGSENNLWASLLPENEKFMNVEGISSLLDLSFALEFPLWRRKSFDKTSSYSGNPLINILSKISSRTQSPPALRWKLWRKSLMTASRDLRFWEISQRHINNSDIKADIYLIGSKDTIWRRRRIKSKIQWIVMSTRKSDQLI